MHGSDHGLVVKLRLGRAFCVHCHAVGHNQKVERKHFVHLLSFSFAKFSLGCGLSLERKGHFWGKVASNLRVAIFLSVNSLSRTRLFHFLLPLSSKGLLVRTLFLYFAISLRKHLLRFLVWQRLWPVVDEGQSVRARSSERFGDVVIKLTSWLLSPLVVSGEANLATGRPNFVFAEGLLEVVTVRRGKGARLLESYLKFSACVVKVEHGLARIGCGYREVTSVVSVEVFGVLVLKHLAFLFNALLTGDASHVRIFIQISLDVRLQISRCVHVSQRTLGGLRSVPF